MNNLRQRGIGAACKFGLGPTLMRLRSSAPPIVLMYHGVTDAAPGTTTDHDGKHVQLSLFREQLKLLAGTRRVVPVATLVETLAAGGETAGMLAITFDDGYLNNLTTAAPALKDAGLPATFFLATGFLDERRWLWNDRIETTIFHTKRQDAQIDIAGEHVSLADVGARRDALRKVKRKLKQFHWRDAQKQVEDIARTLEVDAPAPTGLHEFMTWDQARKLPDMGFTLGAHTVNHAILSRVPPEEAEREILDSRDRIVAMTGTCSTTFCYPNGKRADYTSQTVDFCREHFDAALSAEYGPANEPNLFEIRRVPVDNSTTPNQLSKLILQAA